MCINGLFTGADTLLLSKIAKVHHIQRIDLPSTAESSKEKALDKMYFLVSLSWPKIIQISHFLVPKMSNFDDTLLGKANQVPKDH